MFTAQQKQIENCSRFESVTKTLTEHSQMKSKENLNNNENKKKISKLNSYVCNQTKRMWKIEKKRADDRNKKKQNQKRSKIKQRK